MDTQWIEDEIERAINQVLMDADPETEDRVIRECARKVRRKLIVQVNDCFNRIRRGLESVVEKEREEVP